MCDESMEEITGLQAKVTELDNVIYQARGYVEMIERHLKPDDWNLEHALHFQRRALAWLESYERESRDGHP